MIQHNQTDDRRNDQRKRQGQPAHGALVELLLVASGRRFLHGLPEHCIVLGDQDNTTTLLPQPPKQPPALAGRPVRRKRMQSSGGPPATALSIPGRSCYPDEF
jgi:hypothetical protein